MSDSAQALETRCPARELWLRPDFRRSTLYWAGFWILLEGWVVACCFAGITSSENVLAPLVISPVFVAPAALAWRFRIRVDDRGVWRRGLLRWDLWTWEVFASGAVRQGAYPYAWSDPGKPWHRRMLNLGWLAPAECEWLAARVRQVWTLPAILLPDEVKIRVRERLRERHLELSPRGIVLWREQDSESRHYPWSDVVRVRVTRYAHWKRDFLQMELELPAGEPVQRLRGGPDATPCNWNGPDAETVLACVLNHTAADRVEVTALTGTPQTPDEADRLLSDLERHYRRDRNKDRIVLVVLVLWAFSWLFMGRGALNWDRYQWFAIGCVYLIIGLLGLAIRMSISQDWRRYEQRRAELAGVAREREEAPCAPSGSPG
jgi:hypothetical protein